ncbi:DUF5916 domain-containing protein [Longimicrobium sp.]|uniref:DUF5916 domain-containing protein n=1 Tax=Longimicrobium sp. TaxID=2029185 RepID=UPI002E3193E9|nr:DUF5916 domain-containing protein [Longimicrobium sp.]HEX6040884.1 DUF5916 domain-containing protein [Longimicrobium sp.]
MRITPLLLLVLAAVPLPAQQGQAPAAAGGAAGTRRVAGAAPLTGQVRVDGRLDDDAWASAPVLTDFTQAYPNPGAPASERTEVRVLVGPDALYVGARMFDSSPDSIASQLSRRDVTGYADRVNVFLDARDDHRTAFTFGVNPRGVKIDSYQFDDTREDLTWDAVWDVGTTVDSLGWTAEFRIPFSQLRFPPEVQGERVWGFAVMRDLARRDERSTWSPWTRNSPGFVSSFGELRGLQAVRAPTRLEILPYTSARLERSPGDGADPFYRENDLGGQVGADFQYGLPGGLTLTGTLNPDFGQVEVDPAVVNLSAFEVFLAERRPFFVEGSDIFRFGDVQARNYLTFPQYFYSRRIGRAPQRRVSGSDIAYVDVPDQSTILGAVKVSGRTAGGWSVGVLNAVTAEEQARFRTSVGDAGTQGVEPMTNYFVGRVRRDLNRGNTVVGAILTATNRDMSDTLFAPVLRGDAYIAGIDALHSWKNREWTLSGFLAGSRVGGSERAIAGAQLSSARYFQRPDADHLEYDPARTSLGGRIGALALNHTGRWDGSLVYQEMSPGFEPNDLGYQAITDRRAFSTYLGRRVNRPMGAFRNNAMAVFTNHAWTYGGENVLAEYGATVSGTLKTFWNGGMTFVYSPDYMDDRLTRGGPLALAVANWRLLATLGSDRRKRVSFNASGTWQDYTSGELIRALSGTATFRPSTSLQVSVGPKYQRVRSEGQFITARADSLARGTFGRRYVFSDVDQTTLSFDTRVNWTFTPNLSLEVFAQPYVSAGDFSNYKEFLTPGGYEFLVYGQDGASTLAPGQSGGFVVDPDGPAGPASAFTVGANGGQRDFTFRSLRGNAVLRWEYRPGSTLFFVWQQQRSGEALLGDVDLGRDLSDVFQEPASNVFLIKATYWVGR